MRIFILILLILGMVQFAEAQPIPGGAGIPKTASVKTGSYVLAGKYACLVVNLEGSATFTIGGVTAIRGTQNSVISGLNLNSTDTLAGRLNVGTTATNGASLTTVGTDQKTVIAEFCLPSGLTINGSGTWRALVIEY